MLRVCDWQEWHGAAAKAVIASRKRRDIPLEKPYSLAYLHVPVRLPKPFLRFADLVGGQNAETFWVRTLQVAGERSGLFGVIDTDRDKFGRFVLSREWDTVSTQKGKKVYDALIASGLCDTTCPSCGHGTELVRDEPGTISVPTCRTCSLPPLLSTPPLSSRAVESNGGNHRPGGSQPPAGGAEPPGVGQWAEERFAAMGLGRHPGEPHDAWLGRIQGDLAQRMATEELRAHNAAETPQRPREGRDRSPSGTGAGGE